jgi:signal transduction histidine kinase
MRDRSRLVRLCMVLLALLLAAAPAFAADRIVARQLLEDPSGQLGIADVVTRDFAAMPNILVAGYSDSAFWLKLTVRPEAGDHDLVLRAWPTYVDELTLYAPDGAGGWTSELTGDHVPFAERSAAGVSLTFAIAPTAETTYFLRLKSTSTSMLGVEAIPHGELFADDLRFGIAGALLLGLMIAMLIWAGLEYVATRETLMLWYIAAQAISVTYGLCLTGYLGVLLPWAQLDGMTSIFVWAATFSQILFYLQLLRNFDVPRGAAWLVGPLVIAEIAVPLLFIAGFWRIGLQLNALCVLTAPPAITILAFLARGEAPPGRNVVRLAGLLQTSALVVSSFPVLGIAAATMLSRHGLLVHGALSGAVAFLILRARSTQVRRATFELGLARRQLEVERHEHDVRGRFLAMLSHELKTPLSVIRLSLPAIPAESPARGRVAGAIDSMTALIDLSTCAERLEQGQLPVQHEPVAIDDVINRIATETSAPDRLKLSGITPLRLRTDPQLFDVVVRNLVDNALKYSPPDSTVDIVVRESEGGGPNGVIITVENLVGRGLPDPEKMFEKFYRGPGATSRAGLGLGLYVVRGIAELLGGTVNAHLDDKRLRLEVWHPC